MMHVKNGDETLALLPADFVARGPLVDRKKSKPKYLSNFDFFTKIKKSRVFI